MAFMFAVMFLSRIRIPVKIKYTEKLPAKSMSYYPLVGLIFGVILVIIDYVLAFILPLNIVNIFLLIILVYLSGGLHLDGFMDTMDGIFSARKKEKIIEIMHDSSVGAFGVIAFVLLLLLKLNTLVVLTGSIRLPVLILMPVLSRWFIVLVAYLYPTIIDSKLAKDFSKYLNWKQLGISSFWIVLLIIILDIYGFPYYFTLLVTAVSLFIVVLFCNNIKKIIGGVNGDVYGAVNEITEVLILLNIIVFEFIIK
jgi:adenosylcobinamide-GDP ribazoletransferase